MRPLRALGVSSLTILAVLGVAGCPQVRIPVELDGVQAVTTPADDAAGTTPVTKDEAVYRVLGEPVETGLSDEFTVATDGLLNVPAADALAPALLEEVAVSEEAMLAEVAGDDASTVHGRLAGRFWHDVPTAASDESGGIFQGQWVAADGTPLGFIHGRYRPLAAAELAAGLSGGGVFFGQYVDLQGRFQGFLRGRYGHALAGAGLFFGRWFDREDQLAGVLKGHWRDEPGTGGGVLAGRWAGFDLCAEVATLPEYGFEAGDFGGLEAVRVDPAAISSELERGLFGAAPAAAALDEWPCLDPNVPHGFLRGHYAPAPDDLTPDGIVRARWFTPHAVLVGVMRGVYEPFPLPEEAGPGQLLGRFYCRYQDTTGQVRGYVRGVYGLSAHYVGVFRGAYFDVNGVQRGDVLGRWRIAPQHLGGPLRGVWFGSEPAHP